MPLLGRVAALCMNACAQTWTYMCMTEKNRSAVLVKRNETQGQCACNPKTLRMWCRTNPYQCTSDKFTCTWNHMHMWCDKFTCATDTSSCINIRVRSTSYATWDCYLHKDAICSEDLYSALNKIILVSCSTVEEYFSFASQDCLTWFCTPPLLKGLLLWCDTWLSWDWWMHFLVVTR